jgi:single-stranded-DNA-specific exonuclease
LIQKRWHILQNDAVKTNEIYEALKINKTLCKILGQRNFDDLAKAKEYFRPQLHDLHDPWLMKDMAKAVTRILTAFELKEKILVFGDYDVDGTTSVATMYLFFKKIHPNIDFYIPNRYREGYGISKQGIDFAKENQFSLIISLDCGIKNAGLIAYATTLGIDFIVCDHHLPDDDLPLAVAILNPKQKGCNYPYKELCGCGVGFKLMQALSNQLKLNEQTYLCYLDLVAVAIAADIVPLTGENRTLAFYGLQKINENPCPGLKALIKLSDIRKEILITTLAFVIAPRINAAGRMDDAKKAVQLFIEQDPGEAIRFAQMLQSDNFDRKEADIFITGEALAIINNDPVLISKKTTVVYNENWNKGVVGIVASRLIDQYYRPTVVLTRNGDFIGGSARSVAGFNLYEAIHACRKHLIVYGGHFAAAGLTLLPENMEAFSEAFEEVVTRMISPESLIPEIIIDTEVQFSELTRTFYNILTQMEPFGPGNMRPVFIARRVFDYGFSKIVKDQHIRFVVKQNNISLTGIGFNMADKFYLLQLNEPFDIVFTLDLNEWNAEKSLQMKVIDIRLAVN